MTPVLRGITDAVYVLITSLECLHDVSSLPVNTASLERARDQMALASATWTVLGENLHEPVQPEVQPPVWNAMPEMPVVKIHGMGRYKLEVDSAKESLLNLTASQQELAAKAQSSELFSGDAAGDLQAMQVRMLQLNTAFGQLESKRVKASGAEKASNEMEALRQKMFAAANTQQELNAAVQDLDVEAANAAYKRMQQQVSSLEQGIRNSTASQVTFSDKIKSSAQAALKLGTALRNGFQAIGGTDSLKQVMGLSDKLTQNGARLQLMTGGAENAAAAQSQIFAAAQRSNTPYFEMAEAVEKISMGTNGVFQNVQETAGFAELLNKQYAVAGASPEQSQTATSLLTQALGAGAIKGQDLNEIYKAAPNLIQNIADYMGVPVNSLGEMAEQGLITAEVIKNAMFASADGINEQFNGMPKTIGQIWTGIQNEALQAFLPLLERISSFVNSTQFQELVDGICSSFQALAPVADAAFSLIEGGIQFLMENAESVKMGLLLLGVVAAAVGIGMAVSWLLASWPILLIIGSVLLLAMIIQGLGISVNDVMGFICGVVSAAGAFVWNLFLSLFEFILGLVNYLVNPILEFVNFFANVFDNPVSSIIYLFQGLVDTSLGLLESIASALDFLFGSNMADTVAGWRVQLKASADDMVATYAPDENYQRVTDNLDLSVKGLGLSWIDVTDAWSGGYQFGQNFGDGFNSIISEENVDHLQGINDHTALSAANTGKMADSMELSEEDLQYLREVAERETINRFTTAEIKVELGGVSQHLGSYVDADEVIDYMVGGVYEGMAMAAEGVYA